MNPKFLSGLKKINSMTPGSVNFLESIPDMEGFHLK